MSALCMGDHAARVCVGVCACASANLLSTSVQGAFQAYCGKPRNPKATTRETKW